MSTTQCLVHTMYSVNKNGIILENLENTDEIQPSIIPPATETLLFPVTYDSNLISMHTK